MISKHSANKSVTETPLIVDVARFSLHDGPGIRSVVFFKGCPLRCVFCHNPETQNPGPEIAFFKKKCVQCGVCLTVCDQNAINFELDHPLVREKCNSCGRCVEECPSGALHLFGKSHTIESLTELLSRDIEYYRNSDGGVTLSGGECLLFPHYLNRLMTSLKKRDIHILIQTSGYFDYDSFRDLALNHVDTIYYDLKFMDALTHQRYCGKANTRILDNFEKLLTETNVVVQPRIPLIPGLTDSECNLSGIGAYLGKLGVTEIHTMPYNPTAETKYASLGRKAPDLARIFTKPEETKKSQDMLIKGMIKGVLKKPD